MRFAVTVREATPDDLPVLLALWQQMRDEGPRRSGRFTGPAALESVERRYRAAMTDPGARIVVAEAGGEIAGMALYELGSASTILDVPAVEMSHVCVADGQRRRGAGKALVAGAAAYAEELGVEQVVVAISPQQREANRFYARLGFAPVVVRRAASVTALRRRLALPERRVGAIRVPRRRVPAGRER